MIKKTIAIIDNIMDATGALASVLLIGLVGVIAYNVVARYAFNASSIGLEELAWHFYSALFLLGIPYALKTASHVRVDLLYERFSLRTKSFIDLLGCIFFLLPLCLVVIYSGWLFTVDAWSYGEKASGLYALLQQIITEGVGERSQDPGGLMNRWFIKGVIPFSFFLLLLATVSHLLRQIQNIAVHTALDTNETSQ